MGSNLRLVAFAAALLLGAGFALKHRMVSAPSLPAPVEEAAQSAEQTVSRVEEAGTQFGQQVQRQVAPQTSSAQAKAPLGGMHKCVGGGSTTYTTDDCPPGTKRVEMGSGGTVTTMRTNLDGAASSKKNSIPNARELLNGSDDATKMQELKDKRMDRLIETGRAQ